MIGSCPSPGASPSPRPCNLPSHISSFRLSSSPGVGLRLNPGSGPSPAPSPSLSSTP